MVGYLSTLLILPPSRCLFTVRKHHARAGWNRLSRAQVEWRRMDVNDGRTHRNNTISTNTPAGFPRQVDNALRTLVWCDGVARTILEFPCYLINLNVRFQRFTVAARGHADRQQMAAM